MKNIRKFFARRKKQLKADTERDSRKNVIEDLFYDFNKSRSQVYTTNFIRGIFFGFGSALGGTLVVALLLTLLGLLVDLPGGIGDFVQYIVDIVRSSESNP